MKTNVFKILYDPEADSALLVHGDISLPAVISGADEAFRGLKLDGKEIAEFVDQFVYCGGITLPEGIENMSLIQSHEWMKKTLGQCALSLKAAYKHAADFAKLAGPTDQYIFFKAASYGQLLEFNKALLDLVAEVSHSDPRNATTPGDVLELLESAASNNEWKIAEAREEVRRELSLRLSDKPGMSV